MANNYKEGIDFVTDPTGNTPFAGFLFVSKAGDDINAGTDPSLPKLTIQSALTACLDNGSVVIGPGVYFEYNLIDVGTGKTLIGDGLVYLRRDFENLVMTGSDLRLQRLRVSLYDSLGIDMVTASNCTLGVKTITGSVNTISSSESRGNIFENVTITLNSNPSLPADAIINECIFTNCIIHYGTNAVTAIKNCHFSANSILNLEAIADSDQFVYDNINCGITMNSVLYNSLEAAKEFGSFIECLDVDADFNGEAVGNYSLGPQSELFGQGEFAVNITGRSLGYPFNAASPEIITGTGDVIFNESGEWISSGDSAQWETSSIDLFKVRAIGSLDLIGLVDYMNNVPDFDNKSVNLNDPNVLDVEMRWADTLANLPVATYQAFRWNEKPTYDGALYNGNAGFNWANQQPITARFVQYKVIVRNNYVV